MKYNFNLVGAFPYVPTFKCSFWTVLGSIAGPVIGGLVAGPVGAAIGAGLTAGASALSSSETNQTSKDISAQNNATQLQIARENNALSASQFNQSMQFNSDQAQLNRDYQTRERLATQAYNSPAAQRQRLLAGGVNPQLALDGSPVASQSMSGDFASAPSVPGPSMPSFGLPTLSPLNAGIGFEALNTALSAQKVAAETEGQYLSNKEQQFNNSVRGVRFQLEVADALAKLQAMRDAHKISDKQYEHLAAEVTHNAAMYPLIEKEQSGKSEAAASTAIKIQKEASLVDEKIETERIQRQLAQDLAKSKIKVDNATIANLAASSAQAYAQADKLVSEKADIDDRHKAFVNRVDIELQILKEQKLVSEQQVEEIIQRVKRIHNENDWFKFMHENPVLNQFQRVFESMGHFFAPIKLSN